MQRVIAAHQGVATVSEPWLLLPFLYSLRKQGVAAEYTHPLMVKAVEDFCAELPAGLDDYLDEIRTFVLRLYEKAAGDGARYFVDKTPPYYFIADEIMDLFPEAKFIFLWRNPLSIVASATDTYGDGKFSINAFREDLFIGLPRLISISQANGHRAHSVRFEELVGGSESRWRQVFDYLGIEFDPAALERFHGVALHGRSGDPTGVHRYKALSTEPTNKWRQTLANPLRKEWGRRYLRFLGRERLEAIGFDYEQLLAQLNAQPSGTNDLLGDLRRLFNDVAREPVRARERLSGPSAIKALWSA